MAANTKKIILFIVDGPTDEDALSPVLKKIFQNTQVEFPMRFIIFPEI